MGDRPQEEERLSLFFWLVVGAAGFYLGVRLIQTIVWVVQRIG